MAYGGLQLNDEPPLASAVAIVAGGSPASAEPAKSGDSLGLARAGVGACAGCNPRRGEGGVRVLQELFRSSADRARADFPLASSLSSARSSTLTTLGSETKAGSVPGACALPSPASCAGALGCSAAAARRGSASA